jgi:hypothetical protein
MKFKVKSTSFLTDWIRECEGENSRKKKCENVIEEHGKLNGLGKSAVIAWKHEGPTCSS